MDNNVEPAVETSIKPCRHMAKWVNSLADGTLTGLARWYTRLHISDCKRCRATLEALLRLRERLQSLRNEAPAYLPVTLSSRHKIALEAALDEVDERY